MIKEINHHGIGRFNACPAHKKRTNMRKFTNFKLATITATSCLALLASTAYAKDAPTLNIKNFIGTVQIETSDVGTITITDADGADFTQSGKNITIDDDRDRGAYQCRYKNKTAYIGKKKWGVTSSAKNYKNINEYPVVKITAPESVYVEIRDAIIFGEIKTIGSGDIHVGSCGDLQLGDVNGEFNLRVSGAGDVKMGDAGNSTISISGSGDLEAGDFNSANIVISGAGDIVAGDINQHAKIQVSGSGDISLARINGGLEYKGSGSSDFDADFVGGGDLSIRASGSSDIIIKDGEINTLTVKTSGSSDVTFKGSAVNAEVSASGSSDINIKNPSGQLKISDSGAANVTIK
jgi:Putative auto-transporter adhesin, head GIN domain